MQLIVIPAFAVLAMVAWWSRRDTRLLEPTAAPTLRLAGLSGDRLVVAPRRDPVTELLKAG